VKRTLALAALLAALAQIPAFAGEIIIWYDEQGAAHSAGSAEEIPPRHRPQAQGVLTSLTPEIVARAAKEGAAAGADPLLYNEGLGLFQPFKYLLDMEEHTGYVFVGTKYNLIKARAASESARGGKVPAEFIRTVRDTDKLPVGFYSWNFTPVLLMLTQEGNFIKGDDGFEKGADPVLKVPASVKAFPYEALDFSRPVQVQVYNREGHVVEFRVDLSALR
jgi:hypothetical protein